MAPCSGIFAEDVCSLWISCAKDASLTQEIANIVVAADGGANRILDMENTGDPDCVSEAITVSDI